MEPGSAADWVNAIGTLLAFVGAASAALIAWNSYRAQLRQTAVQLSALERSEQLRVLEQERAQASKVAFWVGVTSEGPGVAYVNTSGLPVYDIAVHVVLPRGTVAVEYRALGPTAHEFFMKRVRNELVERFPRYRDAWYDLLRQGRFSCVVGFRDAANRWWVRDRNGHLVGQQDRATLETTIAGEVSQEQDASR